MIKSLLGVSGVFAVLGLLMLVSQVAQAAGNPVIYQLQVGATGFTNKEYISVYNNSPAAVDTTGWCLKYGATTEDSANLGCLIAPDAHTKLWLPAHGYLVAASSAFKVDYPASVFDITFASGSIAGKDRYIRLLDAGGVEIDRLGWGGGTAEGTAAANPVSPGILQRVSIGETTLKDTNDNLDDFGQVAVPVLVSSSVYEVIVQTDICINIDGLQTQLPAGYLKDAAGNCQADLCFNIDDLQTSIPAGYESSDGENCNVIPLENATLYITELLPNATSYDAGNEFIEIYNPNNRPISLKGYILQSGPDYSKSYPLPDQIIGSGAYQAFSDTQTGLVLPNSSASVRLVAPNGEAVSLAASYEQPIENNAWALIDGVWQYTNQPTPANANLPMLINTPDEEDISNNIVSFAPCRQDQERNHDTNRCRLIQLAALNLTACKIGQERNPETNRCRSIGASDSELVPCKADQERNPETNRCRAIIQTASSLTPCDEGQERNPETNRCRKSAGGGSVAGIAQVRDLPSGSVGNNPRLLLVTLAVIAALGYAFYEWRHEVFSMASRFKTKFHTFSPK